jgi:hypothetical protein
VPKGGYVADSVNLDKSPALHTVWGAEDVGWYYTPRSAYKLISVQTDFPEAGGDGAADGRTVTEVVYDTNTPAAGGALLRSAGFVPVNNTFTGGVFDPLALEAGHRYFIGFENVNFLGVNVTMDAGATSLGTTWSDSDKSGSFAAWEVNDFTTQPRLRFIGTPEPGGLTLFGAGVAGVAASALWRRRAGGSTGRLSP